MKFIFMGVISPCPGREGEKRHQKLPIVMKLLSVFILATALQVSANAEAQRITISQKDAPLQTVFKEIQRQSGYQFFYNDKLLHGAKKVNIQVKDATLQQALEQCFRDQPLTWSLIDGVIVVEKKSSVVIIETPPPLITVHGRVTDENGNPATGVSVVIKGTSKGTETNNNGEFTLTDIDDNAILVFTAVNLQTFELQVKGKNNFDISLKTKISALDKVTVLVSTGYQTISKERSAGAFAKPDMNTVYDRSTSMNIIQRLDGLIPGLVINNSPNNDNPVSIRGLTSISSNRLPLFVVDGIPIDDINTVNPQDVADITVLKDATAASIWGSRAANGVVVIVTKRGSNTNSIKVQYDGFTNFQGKPDFDYVPYLNSPQFIQAAKETFDPVTFPYDQTAAYAGSTSTGLPPHERILYNQMLGRVSAAQANTSLDSLAALDNRAQIKDLWYRNAVLMNHTLSLSGGGKKYAFYGSFAYTDVQSNRPGEKNNSYKVHLRQDFTINDNIKLYVIADLLNEISSTPRNINVDNKFYPYQLFINADGSNISMPYLKYLNDSLRLINESKSRISLNYNPADEVDYGYSKSNSLSNLIIGGASIKLLKALRFEGTYGYTRSAGTSTSYDNERSYKARSEVVQFAVPSAIVGAAPIYNIPATGGQYNVSTNIQRNWTVRNQLVYDNNWKNKLHQLTMLAGQEALEYLSVATASSIRGYNEQLQSAPLLNYASLNQGINNTILPTSGSTSFTAIIPFSSAEFKNRFTNYYGNLGYTYSRKYTVNASARIDHSNLFGLDKAAQNKPVWSLGGKWDIGSENFMSKINWLNHLALRTTYGITGNAPNPGTASSYDIIIAAPNTAAPGGTSLNINSRANRSLSWERTATLNLGVDFSILKEKLSGSIDWYQKKTEDLIGALTLNPLAGGGISAVGNFGNLQNKGFEISLNSVNIRAKTFSWRSGLSLGHNKNKITNYSTGKPGTTGNSRIASSIVLGMEMFPMYTFQYAGLDSVGDPQIQLNDKTITKKPNASTVNDAVYMGPSQPPWSGGFSNAFNYKDFGLSINTVFGFGGFMRRDVNNFYTGRLTHAQGSFNGNVSAYFADRWKRAGDEAFTNTPSYVSDASLSASRRDVTYFSYADINVVSSSFIKIRDITFSYSLPNTLLSRMNIGNISFRAQLSNLLLWKANKYDIDPEFQDALSGTRSIRTNQQTVTLGVRAVF